MIQCLSFQKLSFFLAIYSFSFWGMALGLQHYFLLEPCTLCLLQQSTYASMGLGFLIAALHNPQGWGRWLYWLNGISCSALGLWLAGRQVWLQHLPAEQMPACTAGLEQLLLYQPWLQAMQMILMGSGDCSKIDFEWWGLSLAHWSALGFLMALVFSMVGAWCTRKQNSL